MMKDQILITPDWISGFTQSDGSFIVGFMKTNNGLTVRPVPIFNITQSNLEYNLFIEIQKTLGIGKVYNNRQNVIFVVKPIDEIVDVLIPLFEKYPLKGSKLIAFNNFKTCALMIKEKKHLTLEGLIQIMDLCYFMNLDTTLRSADSKEVLLNKLIKKHGKLPVVNSLKHDKSINLKPLTLEFVRGLIDGDGSFNVSFVSTRRRINVNFTVVCELASISVLEDLVTFFNCGKVYKLQSNAARFQVQSVDDILNKVYPKLKSIKFNTIKQAHFEKTIKVSELIANKGYKTDEDLKTIVDLAWDMNKEGKGRKISKSDYLLKFIQKDL